MFGGGGGLNPRKMKQMMQQMGLDPEAMGIDVQEIEAEEVVIRTADGEELVFDDADVTRMDAQGQQTYQVVGNPESREATERPDAEAESEASGSDDARTEIPDGDVEIVATRTGVSEDAAREALEAADGDLAAAVDRLENDE